MQSKPIIAVFALLLGSSAASAGTPQLTVLFPAGGQRGTTVEVDFIGRYMDNPREVLFYEPGITAESIKPVATALAANGREVPIPEGTRYRVRLKIAADCPLGPHAMRMRTRDGVTELRQFFVSPFANVKEEETPQARNDTRATAQRVPVNSTVVGRLMEGPDVDFYRIDVKRGERISAEIEAARLGVERGIPDMHLAIYDTEGKKLGSADDSALYVQDPVLSVVAPRDGAYFVEVRHCMYNGAGDLYRLHIGTFARPTAIYPAGGQAGTETKVRILGDPTGAWEQTVRLPEATGDFRYVATSAGVPAPSPNILRVSPFGNVLEAEPNNTPDATAGALVASLPTAFNGIIDKPGDVDCFRFRAKKGEQLTFHAMANALGSPVDPVIWIRPADGKGNARVWRETNARPNQLGLPPSQGLNRDIHDPVLEFTAPADGEYILGIEDERGGGGSDFVYRIEARPTDNAVYTYIVPEPDNRYLPQLRQSITVAAGNRCTVQVAVFSTSRPFDGELELVALNLPKGVTMHAPKLTPSLTRVPVVFSCEDGVKPQAAFLDLIVRPVGASQRSLTSGYRQTVVMNQYANNDYYLHTTITKLALVVAEPAPFYIEVEPPKSSLVQNGEMALKFKVHRAKGFNDPVTVQLEWRPTGVSTSTPVTIPANKSEGTYLLGASRNAAAGTYPVTLTAMTGDGRVNYRDAGDRLFTASQPISLTVSEPHVEARIGRTSIERGKTATVVCRLNHLQKFDGKATATLARLPRGIELVETTREFTAKDTEVTFTLRATGDALVGNYRGIVLDVTVIENGQEVRQLSGSGILRIDPERK